MNKLGKLLKGGLKLFGEAYKNTRRQMLTSVVILIVITLFVALLMWWAEYGKNPEFGFVDALVWNFVKYVGDPAEVGEPPITGLGKFMGTLVGVLGIAIFAVPAGLIGSGLIDAMNDEKRENELQVLQKRIRKAFRRDKDKILSKYLKDNNVKNYKFYFVPQEIPVYKMQSRQNIDLKDIIDCCKKFPEIRLKNVAQAKADADSRFVVEYAYLNRRYGCFINRKSRVTIVSTSSYAEKGTGWFAYYLAKMGGFNFISKEVEVDVDDQDPYYNLNEEPRHDMKTLSKLTDEDRKDRELVKKLKLKQNYRDAFFDDLAECCQQDGAWVIVVKQHLRSDDAPEDFHLAHQTEDGKPLMMTDIDGYDNLCQALTILLKEEGLEVRLSSKLYPLEEKKYSIKFMQQEKKKKEEKDVKCNSFVLRPSSEVMNLKDRKLVYAYRIATLLSQHLDNGRGMQNDDSSDLQEEGYGYQETGHTGKDISYEEDCKNALKQTS